MTRIIAKAHPHSADMMEIWEADARGEPARLYAVVHEELFWLHGANAQQHLRLINRIREQSDGVLFTLVPEGV